MHTQNSRRSGRERTHLDFQETTIYPSCLRSLRHPSIRRQPLVGPNNAIRQRTCDDDDDEVSEGNNQAWLGGWLGLSESEAITVSPATSVSSRPPPQQRAGLLVGAIHGTIKESKGLLARCQVEVMTTTPAWLGSRWVRLQALSQLFSLTTWAKPHSGHTADV